MRHRVTWGFASLVALALYANPACAEGDFGRPGTFAISAERLFGVTSHSLSYELAGADVTQHQTNVSLLTNTFLVDSSIAAGYSTARLGFDYFVIQGLSVGGSLGFFTFSRSTS